MVVYGSALLGLGSWYDILWPLVSAIVGVWMFSIVLVGFFRKPVHIVWRILLGIGGLSLVKSGLMTDMVGLGILILFLLTKVLLSKKKEPAVTK